MAFAVKLPSVLAVASTPTSVPLVGRAPLKSEKSVWLLALIARVRPLGMLTTMRVGTTLWTVPMKEMLPCSSAVEGPVGLVVSVGLASGVFVSFSSGVEFGFMVYELPLLCVT